MNNFDEELRKRQNEVLENRDPKEIQEAMVRIARCTSFLNKEKTNSDFIWGK